MDTPALRFLARGHNARHEPKGPTGPGSAQGSAWNDLPCTAPPPQVYILNAQWLPGGDQLVHDNVSSVNTFRIILKHQFGLDLEPLPDLSYVVEDHLPYRYLPVEADLRPQ